MVQIQKAEKKAVYRYLLQEGVIVIHKDYTTQPHKGTNIPNIHVRTLLRSLKDRGFVELVFSWQYFYYFINNEGKKYLSEYLNLTEEVVPLTWKYPIYHSGRTKRDSTNTSSRTRASASAEKTEVTGPKDPRAKEEEAEELPVLPEESAEKINPRPKSLPKPLPLDLFVNLSFDEE